MSAEYVSPMEDLPEVYAPSATPDTPLIGLDAKPVTQPEDLLSAIPPTPAAPGQQGQQGQQGHPERRDYAYVRRGCANRLVLVAPHRGGRHGAVTDHHATPDDAQWRDLAEEAFPPATCIRLGPDTVSTHTLVALDATFPSARAPALARRFVAHPTPTTPTTPKHARWLTLAEIARSVVSRGSLTHRVPTTPALAERVAALTRARHAAHAAIDWRGSVLDARTTLQTRYPEPLIPRNNLN